MIQNGTNANIQTEESSYYYTSDGEEKVIHVHERVEDCEKYVPDEQLTENVFGRELRTLTVIANPECTQVAEIADRESDETIYMVKGK